MTTRRIQALGSYCYNETGITFPREVRVNWQATVLQDFPDAGNFRWERWQDNQPPNLLFDSEREGWAGTDVQGHLPYGFIYCEEVPS